MKRSKPIGKKQKAAGTVEVKKLTSGKFTFKLSHFDAVMIYNAITHNQPRNSPKYAHAVLHACAWYCIVEVLNKTLWANPLVKFTLTPAQASAICYMLIPYDQPLLIDLKAKLLKAL